MFAAEKHIANTMFDFIIETVKKILTHYFIRIPGASVRFVVSGKKGFEEYIEDDLEYNVISVLSALTVLVLILNFYIIVRLF